MEPSFLQEEIPQNNRSHINPRSKKATWICLPYFCIEEYSNRSISEHGTHPTRTLLQTRISSAPRARDMEQAVCKAPKTDHGHCFHVAQLWCLVLDQSILITCSKESLSTLQSDSLSMQPSSLSAYDGRSVPRVRVSYGPGVLWSFDLDECSTWFRLLVHFWEFYPKPFYFVHGHRETRLTPSAWPSMLARALATQTDVRLQLRFVSEPMTGGMDGVSIDRADTYTGPVRRLIPKHLMESDSKTRDAVTSNQVNHSDEYSAFAITAAQRQSKANTTYEKELSSNLQAMDNYLRHKTTEMDQIAYRACPIGTLEEAVSLLEGETPKNFFSNVAKPNELSVEQYKWHLAWFDSVVHFFRLFVPLETQADITAKFWGSICRFLEVSCQAQLSFSRLTRLGFYKRGEI
jgi:hypothetical protein